MRVNSGDIVFFIPLQLRLFSQDCIQKRIVNFYFSVVTYKAELPEFVHKVAHARSRCADHFGQSFLTDIWVDRCWAAFLAKLRK